MQHNTVITNGSRLRELNTGEIDEVSGGLFAIGRREGGLYVEAGSYSLSVWTDAAIFGDGSSYSIYRW